MNRPTLHGIRSRLVHRASGCNIGADFMFTKDFEGHLGPYTATEMDFTNLVVHGKPGDDFMVSPGQGRQHAERLIFINRLAHDPAIQHDYRIGTDEEAPVRRCGHGISLFTRQAHDMLRGYFTRQHILTDIGRNHAEFNACQGHQFRAAGRCRGEYYCSMVGHAFSPQVVFREVETAFAWLHGIYAQLPYPPSVFSNRSYEPSSE